MNEYSLHIFQGIFRNSDPCFVPHTGTRAASRPFAQWQLTEQNEEAARRALEDGYDVTGSLEKQIHAAVQQLVMNQWLDHRREILGIVGGSHLKGYS